LKLCFWENFLFLESKQAIEQHIDQEADRGTEKAFKDIANNVEGGSDLNAKDYPTIWGSEGTGYTSSYCRG